MSFTLNRNVQEISAGDLQSGYPDSFVVVRCKVKSPQKSMGVNVGQGWTL
jgi:hypothetical protein